MSSPTLTSVEGALTLNYPIATPLPPPDYARAAQLFRQLLVLDDLDQQLQVHPEIASTLAAVLNSALAAAYSTQSGAAAAHQFLQRILYQINRLQLFWYDDLNHYINEDSLYLHRVRHQIETVWQAWELAQLDIPALQQQEVKAGLQQRMAVDLQPPLTATARYLQQEMSRVGYQRLLAIASLEGLVEASRLAWLLPGVSNTVQATLTRIFLEEYGHGHLQRKHSTFFAEMLAACNLSTEPEAYLDLVPWEVLATINQGYLLARRKRYFLRYVGGLTYFELAVPAIHRNYLIAAQRLGLPAAAMSYWELHIREDERHGRWMIDQVALPLVDQYPAPAWELLLGYDQDRQMGDRAGQAVLHSIQQAEATAIA